MSTYLVQNPEGDYDKFWLAVEARTHALGQGWCAVGQHFHMGSENIIVKTISLNPEDVGVMYIQYACLDHRMLLMQRITEAEAEAERELTIG